MLCFFLKNELVTQSNVYSESCNTEASVLSVSMSGEYFLDDSLFQFEYSTLTPFDDPETCFLRSEYLMKLVSNFPSIKNLYRK